MRLGYRTDGDPDTWAARQTCQLKIYSINLMNDEWIKFMSSGEMDQGPLDWLGAVHKLAV